VWVKRVERWRDSGLTLKEFASEVGVNANTLAGWRWRLGSEGGGAEASRVPRFLEIVAPPEATEPSAAATSAMQPAAEPFELILSGGLRVRVPVQFDGRALRRLVDALEAR
jgi:transposase-like protein